MDDDEARLACGIFSIIYGLIYLFIYAKTGINVFESITQIELKNCFVYIF